MAFVMIFGLYEYTEFNSKAYALTIDVFIILLFIVKQPY